MELPTAQKDEGKRWSGNFRYGVSSDFADNRQPRGYMHSITSSIDYRWKDHWSVSGALGLRAETIGGQIPKDEEKTYMEVLNPSSEISLGYEGDFRETDQYSLSVHAEPLWDDASRLEGYQAVMGAGGSASLSFFKGVYKMTHALDLSFLKNSFQYGSNLRANPDYFYTYKWSNGFKIGKRAKISYSFGMKLTRSLDGFWTYAYSNTLGLSYALNRLSVVLAYDNGGFTDKGEVDLWYIDDYRRLFRAAVSYSF